MVLHPDLTPFTLQDSRKEAGFHINCLGAKARDYFPDDWFDITDRLQANEELFEWLDLFEAVRTAGDTVTFVDLGAGYGRWMANVALAARQLGKRYRLVGAEAESTHAGWLREHLADNGVAASDYRLFQSAISDRAREVCFTEGHAQDWYGQAVIPSSDHGFGDWPAAQVVTLQAIDARDVFEGLDRVDAVHIDIQGEEERVVPALMAVLGATTRRVHIGTHSAAVHDMVGNLFLQDGWRPRRVIPFQTEAETEFGPIRVNDGLQSWSNPRVT